MKTLLSVIDGFWALLFTMIMGIAVLFALAYTVIRLYDMKLGAEERKRNGTYALEMRQVRYVEPRQAQEVLPLRQPARQIDAYHARKELT